MYISLCRCFLFRPSQTNRTTMRGWNTLSCFAVVWTLHACLFETRSIHYQRMSTIVVCRIFATTNTAYAVCNTDAFNGLYKVHVDDPCSASSSKVLCHRLEFLSPTSCLAGKYSCVTEKVISAIPPSVLYAEIYIIIAIWRG